MADSTVSASWVLRFALSPRADGGDGDDVFEAEVRAADALDAMRLALAELPIDAELLSNALVEVATAGEMTPGPPVVLVLRRT